MSEALIALTFDDGPNCTTTGEVLDKLEKYGVIASFFLIGQYINEESAKSAKRADALGCELCNHSRTHSAMTTLSPAQMLEEFRFTENKVKEICGKPTAFFRPPYIAIDPSVLEVIPVPKICGIGAEDWMPENPVERRAGIVLSQAKDGDIILLHDTEGNSKTVEALDIIIPELQKRDFGFVTVSQLFTARGIVPQKGRIYTNVMQKD